MPAGLKVVGPNTYLEGVPYEFDLLIVNAQVKPKPDTSLLDAEYVHYVFEVKKGGVYSLRQVDKMADIFDSVREKYPHIKCTYVTIQEVKTIRRKNSINYYDECARRLWEAGHRFFALRDSRGEMQLIPGEWEKFLSFIELM